LLGNLLDEFGNGVEPPVQFTFQFFVHW
jgi:hypothetical protein